jgi:hypothetical protein
LVVHAAFILLPHTTSICAATERSPLFQFPIHQNHQQFTQKGKTPEIFFVAKILMQFSSINSTEAILTT